MHGVIESLKLEEDWIPEFSEVGAPHVSNDDPVLKCDTVIFMPTRLLSTIADQFCARSDPTSVSPICRTVTHDVESFGWVILYTFYRRALADEELKENDSELHEGLSYEFLQMFLNASVQRLHVERVSLLARKDYAPIAMLRAYADEYMKSRPLATFLAQVWTVLMRCPIMEPSDDEPDSQDLREADWLAALNEENQRRGFPQFDQRSVPVSSEEAQERWGNLCHTEWLALLEMMNEDLEEDEQN
ncbi:hypothetical protein FKP32DRAFT_1356172 [Trametes sanguinea]|nr:hypothetical protein FKP32DRAFT_1356172 [Trametes sanguinea]